MLIYHIVRSGDWETWNGHASYRAASLDDEGFIHCCDREQLETVIQRYFSDAAGLVVLTIDTERLTSDLVREPSTNDEIYPHIYGPINVEAIVDASPLPARDAVA